MKIIFMGTPDFAVPVLEKLISEHEVVCVYTRAPAVSGRGKQQNKTPIHILAEKHGIEVRTPKTLKNSEEQAYLKNLGADISIVAAYGLILPTEVIKACPLGCLNVHASLLPRWRGAAPIQRSIEAGDAQSGVTIMRVVEALDAGAMYKKGVVEITPEMTGGELHDRLSAIGADLMSDVLKNIDNIIPEEQDEKFVTYASKVTKEETKIDFKQSADALERKIRAFNPFPAMYFEYEGERFKIMAARVENSSGAAGTILDSNGRLLIACGNNALDVTFIQRQGKRVMRTEELLRGFHFVSGKSVL